MTDHFPTMDDSSKPNDPTPMDVDPKDVDPVDGGPRITAVPIPVAPAPPTSSSLIVSTISTAEEAKNCIDQLRSADDCSQRVKAAHQLDAIAKLLGPERTKEELIPFLIDGMDDEEEVLLAVATSLGRMLPMVDDEAIYLWRPLELLLSLEETTVRQAAVASCRTLLEQQQTTEPPQDFGAMVQRLAVKEWFTARISAAALLPDAYQRQPEAIYLQLFAEVCRDSVSMVRRVAAQHWGAMAQHVVQHSPTAIQNELPNTLLPLLEELAATDQPDAVRLQTTENCVRLGRVCHDQAVVDRVLPLIVATIEDRSWRVRWTAADKFADVMAAYETEATETLVPAYERLLQDPEAEVRTAATFQLPHVARTPAIAERLAQKITALTENDSPHVRGALAAVATQLAPTLGMDATITYLVPPVLLLLRDAASHVRLHVIASLPALHPVIGVDLLSQSLLPAILDLGADRQWRIRAAMMGQINSLAEQLGKEFFTERLCALCLGWLGDDISRIRVAATENIRDLAALFGGDWALQHLLPAVLNMREHPSYLRRLTALQALARLAEALDAAAVQQHILPVLLDMATDIVPNIRFNVAKELVPVAKHSCRAAEYAARVGPVLTVLADDDDRDVRHHAVLASQQLQDFFGC